MTHGLTNVHTRQTFLEEAQANHMSAGTTIFQNAYLTRQNAFLSVDSSQNIIFIGPPNTGEPGATLYSNGGQPLPPGAPGSGAAAVADMSVNLSAVPDQPNQSFIGTPRQTKRTELTRGRTRIRQILKGL